MGAGTSALTTLYGDYVLPLLPFPLESNESEYSWINGRISWTAVFACAGPQFRLVISALIRFMMGIQLAAARSRQSDLRWVETGRWTG